MFLPRSRERQAGHDGKILCLSFFRAFIFAKYEFCAYLECIYFREYCLKENLVLRNRPKFAKFSKICTREN